MQPTICLVERPWGFYRILYADTETWMKELTILPGQALSYQKHRNRDEYWKPREAGLSAIIQGDHMVLNPREVLVVPRGTYHRIMNTTEKTLSVIEWAVGEVDENDIFRLKDYYGRD